MTAFLDLFSGIGGFALGAYWAGLRFDKHYFSEVDDYAIEVYRRRFPDAIPLGDITKIDGRAIVDNAECSRRAGKSCETQTIEDCNGEKNGLPIKTSAGGWILAGGFPCQDISAAGKGAGISGLRSGLWFEYARLIGEIRPRFAIMENVGALTRRGLDRVLGSLAEIGYDAEWSDIRASDIGAPHRRERIWIVAYPAGMERETGTKIKRELRTMPEDERKLHHSDGPGSTLADANEQGLQGRDQCGECSCERAPWACCGPHENARLARSGIRRVSHGVPKRVDRLKCLGNAIVPQIAQMIFEQPIFDEWRA